MAVKTNKVENNEEAIYAAICDSIQQLLEEHRETIVRIRDSSQGKAISVNFNNEIDCSETKPIVTTKINFSEKFTDERTQTIDPAQGKFETIEKQGRGGRKSDGPKPPEAPAEQAPPDGEAA